MAEDIYVAAESAVLQFQGEQVVVHKGVHTIERGHPLLDEYPDLFEPLSVTFAVDDDGGESGETVEGDDEATDDLPAGVTHLGAGWYDVAGEKVRGRDAAVERASAENDADEGDDGE